jgi:hypothetical protein
MRFLERDLEEYLFKESYSELNDKGLDTFICKPLKNIRQLKLTGYGVADMVRVFKHDGFLCFDVIELKKDEINSPTFWQGLNYVRGIQRYLEIMNFSQPYKVSLTLIGKSISCKSPLIYLTDIVKDGYFNVNLFTYNVDMYGEVFFNREHNYRSKKENKNPNRKKKRI